MRQWMNNVAAAAVKAAAEVSRPLLEGLEERQMFAVFPVTNTFDAGAGSLRNAINLSNANPGLDTIAFAIPGAGVHTIQPLAPLPPIVDAAHVDGTTQPGYAGAPLIQLNGSVAGAGNSGLHIRSGGSVVRGLNINRWERGIFIERGGNNVIQRNYIGTDPTGKLPAANIYGVFILESGQNLVGGSGFDARNVISGNRDGVHIFGAHAVANRVQGNFIGTDVSGTVAIGNGSHGVRILHGRGTLVGGNHSGLRNLISGNGTGVALSAAETRVFGNYIGTDVSGLKRLPNRMGVFIDGHTIAGVVNNQVGSGLRGTGNLISANTYGMQIAGGNAQVNLVQGNLIGTDRTGTAALGNLTYGVEISSKANQNRVGGLLAEERNVISANSDGVHIVREATRNSVVGNFIGTDVSGTKPLGNRTAGVRVRLADGNQIGGAAVGARNIISANGYGVFVGAAETVVEGNYVGTDVTGTVDLGNRVGVALDGIAYPNVHGNVIGGTAAGAGNVISGNEYGVNIYGVNAVRNFVWGNSIGTDAFGKPMGNAMFGVQVTEHAHHNWVGDFDPAAGNIIAYNGTEGVVVALGQSNAILSNSIFENGKLGIDLNADGPTLNDFIDLDGGANMSQNFPEIHSVVASGGTTQIKGVLHSQPNKFYHLQFFVNNAPDPSGFGEGERLIFVMDVMTNAAGDAFFNPVLPFALASGQYVTATATDLNTMDTSEFSRVAAVFVPIVIVPPPVFGTTEIRPVGDEWLAEEPAADVLGEGVVGEKVFA